MGCKFGDVDVFVGEVLAELTAMARDGTRPRRFGATSRRWPEQTLRKARDGDLVCPVFAWYAVAGHRGQSSADHLLQARSMLIIRQLDPGSASGDGCARSAAPHLAARLR